MAEAITTSMFNGVLDKIIKTDLSKAKLLMLGIPFTT